MKRTPSIKYANALLKEKKYSEAYAVYMKLIQQDPYMKKILGYNIEFLKGKLSSDNINIVVENKHKVLKQDIFLGIAAIPEREEALSQTIKSLINQVDRIGVYLNGWNHIPDFLNNKKIIIAGYKDKDIGDIGKFYWVDEHDGIYFTCDDDLLYPSDYIIRLLRKLDEYNYNVAVGWHGSLIRDIFKTYYNKDSRRVFVFSAHRPYDTPVHILGTGCCAFHTKKLFIKKKDFLYPNMADIFFAIKAQEQKIPFYVVKHEKDEVVEIPGNKESSIFNHSHKNITSKKNTHELQNKLVLEQKPWILHQFNKKMTILLIGRFETFSKGGIYKSCHLIKTSLANMGHQVDVLDTANDLNLDKLKNHNYDLCWIYPGDPERPDFSTVDEKINILQRYFVPIIVNLSYLYEKNRSELIVKKLKKYNEHKKSLVLAVFFTETAANDPIFSEVLNYTCVIPKTIAPTPYNYTPEFEEREGICLGDATKLTNPKIIGGNVNRWIDAIANKLPHVNLYAYKQYQGKNPHPKVKYIPHMKENFGEWLAHRKLFICLNVHLTFEMVACETQQYGTPVIYRHMPHSLSEYISATGMAVRTPEEMAEIVAWIYNNKIAWNSLSKASQYRAKSNNIAVLDASLEGYLRLVMIRAKNLSK